jgi:hypothetical protein
VNLFDLFVKLAMGRQINTADFTIAVNSTLCLQIISALSNKKACLEKKSAIN